MKHRIFESGSVSVISRKEDNAVFERVCLIKFKTTDSESYLFRLDGLFDFMCLFCHSCTCFSYHVATGSEDNTCRIWDLRSRACLYKIPAHMNLISQVKYQCEGGKFIVTSSYDNTAKVHRDRTVTLCTVIVFMNVVQAAFPQVTPSFICPHYYHHNYNNIVIPVKTYFEGSSDKQ